MIWKSGVKSGGILRVRLWV